MWRDLLLGGVADPCYMMALGCARFCTTDLGVSLHAFAEVTAIPGSLACP